MKTTRSENDRMVYDMKHSAFIFPDLTRWANKSINSYVEDTTRLHLSRQFKNYNICTCEHMIQGQLRMGARATIYAALIEALHKIMQLKFRISKEQLVTPTLASYVYLVACKVTPYIE